MYQSGWKWLMMTKYECFSQFERVFDEKKDIFMFSGVWPRFLQLNIHCIWPNFPSNWIHYVKSSFKSTIWPFWVRFSQTVPLCSLHLPWNWMKKLFSGSSLGLEAEFWFSHEPAVGQLDASYPMGFQFSLLNQFRMCIKLL